MSKTFRRVMQTGLVFLLIVIFVAAGLILLVDPNDYRDEITAKASDALAQELRINGELSWSFWPSFALELDQVELDNPENFEPRNMLTADQLAISLEIGPLLRREIQIKRVDLRNAEMTIVTREDGISNLDHILNSSSSEGESADGVGLRSGPVRLENVDLTVLDETTDSSQRLEILLAELDYYAADEELPFTIAGDVFDGGNPVLSDLSASGEVVIPSDNSPIRVLNLDLAGALSGLSDHFNLDGNVSIDTRNGMLIELADGVAELDGETFSLVASLRSGDISSINFDISGDSLDLDRLLASQGATSGSGTSVEEDLDWLKTTDLDGRINLATVRFNQIDLKNVSARIRSTRGKLSVSPFSATAFGGRIEGSLEVDLNQSPVKVRFSPILSGMNIGALMEHMTGTKLVEATGDLVLDLSGSGLDPTKLLSTLSGGGEYALESGELLGIDLNAMIDEILGAQSLQGFDQAFGGSTSFSLMAGELKAESGVLRTPGLLLQSATFNLSGDGDINLANDSLDYQLSLQLKGDLKAKVAEKTDLLASGRIPIKITGSLAEPSIGFDASSLVQDRVNDELDEKKDELKDKLLRGLFGSDKDGGD